jgi:predicted membrane protein
MKILYFCIVILCLGMIMAEINERDLMGVVPWAISLILLLMKLNDNEKEAAKGGN